MEIEKLIEALGDLEMCAYGYHINGEVLGMDCTDFECLMVDAAEEISKIPALQAENDRLRRERDAAVDEIPKVCYYCKHRKGWKICDRFNGNSEAETCTHWQWRGTKED